VSSRILRIAAFILFAFFMYEATAGVLFKQEVNGNWRTCYYRDGSDVTTLTVPASDPCPVNN
jgi:uncharacterized membrane protein